MNETELRKHRCCFTGHRPEKLKIPEKRLAELLKAEISRAIDTYPTEIRKIIYTTNIIEGLNRQFRQITKNKPTFTNDDSLRKIFNTAMVMMHCPSP